MNILLAISGGIAAYKSCELLRLFQKRGYSVRVVMTPSATEFVSPLTFQALSGYPVGLTLFDSSFEHQIGHISLAQWADVMVVAPASANTIAKLANGIADNLLNSVALALHQPPNHLVVAPAMNDRMWENPALQHNISTLKARGVTIVTPDDGILACGSVGRGRLADPSVIVDAVDEAISPKPLENMTVLVTAGPTREWIDAARFLSNPSTGKMGFEMARIAAHLGAEVELVTGPVSLPTPPSPRIRRYNVTTADHMHGQTTIMASEIDLFILTAAVADFHPGINLNAPTDQTGRPLNKLTKDSLEGALPLVRNRDILKDLSAQYHYQEHPPIIVGFAAQSHDLSKATEEKRIAKGADLMVGNLISGEESAFGTDDSEVCIRVDQRFSPIEQEIWVTKRSKREVALAVFEVIAPIMQQRAQLKPLF